MHPVQNLIVRYCVCWAGAKRGLLFDTFWDLQKRCFSLNHSGRPCGDQEPSRGSAAVFVLSAPVQKIRIVPVEKLPPRVEGDQRVRNCWLSHSRKARHAWRKRGLNARCAGTSLKSRSCVRNACDHASGARKQCSKVNTFEGWGVFCFLSAVSVLFFALAASCSSMALAGQPKLGCVLRASAIRAAPTKELAWGLLRNRRPLLAPNANAGAAPSSLPGATAAGSLR